MKAFSYSQYNILTLGILIVSLTISRFYNIFDSKYIWEVEIKFLFWSFTLQLNKR
jgi:hypothetical protein